MEVIEGEVVDPGTVHYCEPGRSTATRAQMDRRGEYGGVVRESAAVPDGQIFSIDMDTIEANLGDPPPFRLDPPPLPLPMPYFYAMTVARPGNIFRCIATA